MTNAIRWYCRKFGDEMAARHRTRGVLASRALTSRSTANASARDAPGTVLRQHRKSFVPNNATLPICLRLQKSCKLPVDYVRVGVVECLQLS